MLYRYYIFGVCNNENPTPIFAYKQKYLIFNYPQPIIIIVKSILASDLGEDKTHTFVKGTRGLLLLDYHSNAC